MMQLEILTNENVLLFHFVDSVSKWSSYVSPHFRKYFDDTFVATKETTSKIAKYVDYRKPLGYDYETKLFNWAYEGFLENNDYSELLPILNYFANLKDKNQKTVSNLIKNQNTYLQSYLSRFSQQDAHLQKTIDQLVTKLQDLFPSRPRSTGMVKAYLLLSVNSNQTEGGANGGGLYTEIPNIPIDEQDVPTLEFAHEYVHTQWSGKEYFCKNIPIFNQINEQFGEDPIAGLIEEVFVYSVIDVYLRNENINSQYRHYKQLSATDKSYLQYSVLWDFINACYPTIEKYLHTDTDSIEDVRRNLINTLITKVELIIQNR